MSDHGFVMVMGECCACHQRIMFNPTHVPSLWIDPANGLPPDMGGDPARAQREPLCHACARRANVLRIANGKEPIKIHPEAYEPAPAEEVQW